MRALERRYRRLLGCYPAGHREEYGQEMLQILLTAAGPERNWPSAAETADLLASAARLQVRARLRGLAGPVWDDATAVVAVLAPLLFTAGILVVYLPHPQIVCDTAVTCKINHLPSGYLDTEGGWIRAALTVAALTLVLLRRRLVPTAAIAVVTGLLIHDFLTDHLVFFGGRYFWNANDPRPMTLAFLGVLSMAALLLSPGPRRGLDVLGRWRILGWSAGALAFVAIAAAYWLCDYWWWPITVLVAAGVGALLTPAGRRALPFLSLGGGITCLPTALPDTAQQLLDGGGTAGLWPIEILGIMHLTVLLAFTAIAVTGIRQRAEGLRTHRT